MRATAILDFVRRLLTQEAAESQDSESLIEAAERVSHKLRAHLSTRIGQEGFRTLLARALTLTTAQFPQLGIVRVEADGSLVGLREAEAAGSDLQGTRNKETQADAVEGAVALIAHLIGLLVAFIGEDLTQRLLSTVWPEIPLDDANDRENEKL